MHDYETFSKRLLQESNEQKMRRTKEVGVEQKNQV